MTVSPANTVNLADSVGPSSIASFVPKDRALPLLEIRLMVQQLGTVATYPTIKLALRLILLTGVERDCVGGPHHGLLWIGLCRVASGLFFRGNDHSE